MASIIIRLDDREDGGMNLRTWSSNHRDPWDLTQPDHTSAELYATAARNAMHDLQAMAETVGILEDDD